MASTETTVRYGKIITTTRSSDGATLYARFGDSGVEWVEDPNDACHFLTRADAEQLAYGEDCMAIVDHARPAWTSKLTILVGECISDQRNGMDVLASASWDAVVEHWTKQEQGR